MKQITLKEFLIETRAVIAEPEHWTQGAFARSSKGNWVYESSADATCWCLSGAMNVVYQRHYPDDNIFWDARHALFDAIPGNSIVEFNDSHTHAEVIAALDKAIKRLS